MERGGEADLRPSKKIRCYYPDHAGPEAADPAEKSMKLLHIFSSLSGRPMGPSMFVFFKRKHRVLVNVPTVG
jgi:hypothetical protein